MGNNTLETITGGIGRKEQVNQYKEALVGDILPRNLNGEVEALAADLGSESVAFSNLYVNRATVFGSLEVKGGFGEGNINIETKTGTGLFYMPEGVFSVFVVIAGGGGGASYGSGFGGNGGAVVLLEIRFKDQNGSISYAAGAGGAGAQKSPQNGGDSYISIGGQEIARAFGGLSGLSDGNASYRIRPIANSTNFLVIPIGGFVGGADSSTVPLGYYGGANMGGASILAPGGNDIYYNSGYLASQGGGAGYFAGSTPTAWNAYNGNGGGGAVSFIYFKN